MTSSADTIYDNLVTRLGGTLYTGHKRLSDPYNLQNCDDQELRIGWGLAVAPGENTQRFIDCHRSSKINFELKLVRQFFAKAHDIANKATVDKALLMDWQTVLDDSHKNDLGMTDGSICKALALSSVTSARVEREDYRVMTIAIEIEYFRNS